MISIEKTVEKLGNKKIFVFTDVFVLLGQHLKDEKR